jgi:hypothetical protein
MDDRKCNRCTAGRVRCPRCGGAGIPGGGKRLSYFEKEAGRCRDCLGVGTLTCMGCGGIGVTPPKAVLR